MLSLSEVRTVCGKNQKGNQTARSQLLGLKTCFLSENQYTKPQVNYRTRMNQIDSFYFCSLWTNPKSSCPAPAVQSSSVLVQTARSDSPFYLVWFVFSFGIPRINPKVQCKKRAKIQITSSQFEKGISKLQLELLKG